MKLVMQNDGFGQGQHQYLLKLKNWLIKTFGDKILFITPENNTQQIIINRKSLPGEPVLSTIK